MSSAPKTSAAFLDVMRAAKRLWDSKGLNRLFDGTAQASKFWNGEVPPGTQFPYVIMNVISSAPTHRTAGRKAIGGEKVDGTTYTSTLLQLTVYGRNLDEAGNYGALIDEHFDDADLQLTPIIEGEIFYCRQIQCRPEREDNDVWRCLLMYRILSAKGRQIKSRTT